VLKKKVATIRYLVALPTGSRRAKKHHKFIAFKIIGPILFKLDPKLRKELRKKECIKK